MKTNNSIIISLLCLTLFGCSPDNGIIPVKNIVDVDVSTNESDGKSVVLDSFSLDKKYLFNKNLKKYKYIINKCNRDFNYHYPKLDTRSEYNGYLASLLLTDVFVSGNFTVYKYDVAKSVGSTYFYIYDNKLKKLIYSFDGDTF